MPRSDAADPNSESGWPFARDTYEKAWPASERQYGNPDRAPVYHLSYTTPHFPGGGSGRFNGTDGESGFYDISAASLERRVR
jgi:hypothetical protein